MFDVWYSVIETILRFLTLVDVILRVLITFWLIYRYIFHRFAYVSPIV